MGFLDLWADPRSTTRFACVIVAGILRTAPTGAYHTFGCSVWGRHGEGNGRTRP